MAHPDQDERDALVVQNLELVGRIVSEVSARYPRHVDRGELWNAGALGLVEASRRFDPDTGIPFSRYAAIRIRGAIIDSTRTRDWASRSLRRRAREVGEARRSLEEELGRSASPAEVADRLGISVEQLTVHDAAADAATLLRLDQPGSDDEPALADRLPETRAELSPEEWLEGQEMRGALVEAIRRLPRVQAEVVARSYLDGHLLQDIARDMGLTEARLSQIRTEALLSLRAFFATQYEGVEAPDANGPGKRARAAFLEEMATRTTWRSRVEAATAVLDVGAALEEGPAAPDQLTGEPSPG